MDYGGHGGTSLKWLRPSRSSRGSNHCEPSRHHPLRPQSLPSWAHQWYQERDLHQWASADQHFQSCRRRPAMWTTPMQWHIAASVFVLVMSWALLWSAANPHSWWQMHLHQHTLQLSKVPNTFQVFRWLHLLSLWSGGPLIPLQSCSSAVWPWFVS